MKLSATLHNEIVKFLVSIPNIQDVKARQAFVFGAGLGAVQDKISFEGSSEEFVQLLVTTLERYGHLDDGRIALQVIIERAKEYVGPDKRDECDTLIQELQTVTALSIRQNAPKSSSFSLKYVLVTILVVLLILNGWMGWMYATTYREKMNIESYQISIQQIDNLINSKSSGIRQFKSEIGDQIIYENKESLVIARDYFYPGDKLYLREFYDGEDIVARDYFDMDTNGQWYKKRIHFDKNSEAFIQEYFTMSGILLKKEYDEDRDGTYVGRVARFSSPFPPSFFLQFYR